ncbi:Cytochrome b5 reductase 4 [Cyanidiococcus yangmingshanensis]|uniref:Cytochrome b5 reductase 4 n=1 Tax=Cyanidiococcus yangmingshanensis TaxID=2690220 RepID=A0A7J7INJ7_9RHOD|nr:Cytochrome b5 reductase 4 [Cyanidiococcus yangmingshanensis]
MSSWLGRIAPATTTDNLSSSRLRARWTAPSKAPLAWLGRRNELPARETLLRISRAQLRAHARVDDAWTAIHGVVYDITAYLAYHPGGDEILLSEAAGKDGTAAFMSMHPWVNISWLLRGCEVGVYVPDDDDDDDDKTYPDSVRDRTAQVANRPDQ